MTLDANALAPLPAADSPSFPVPTAAGQAV